MLIGYTIPARLPFPFPGEVYNGSIKKGGANG